MRLLATVNHKVEKIIYLQWLYAGLSGRMFFCTALLFDLLYVSTLTHFFILAEASVIKVSLLLFSTPSKGHKKKHPTCRSYGMSKQDVAKNTIHTKYILGSKTQLAIGKGWTEQLFVP